MSHPVADDPMGRTLLTLTHDVHTYMMDMESRMVSQITLFLRSQSPTVLESERSVTELKDQVRAMIPELLKEATCTRNPPAATTSSPAKEPLVGSKSRLAHTGIAHPSMPVAADDIDVPASVESPKPMLKAVVRTPDYPAYELGAKTRDSEPTQDVPETAAKQLVEKFDTLLIGTPPDRTYLYLGAIKKLPEVDIEELVDMFDAFKVGPPPKRTSLPRGDIFSLKYITFKNAAGKAHHEPLFIPSSKSQQPPMDEESTLSKLPRATSINANVVSATEQEHTETTKCVQSAGMADKGPLAEDTESTRSDSNTTAQNTTAQDDERLTQGPVTPQNDPNSSYAEESKKMQETTGTQQNDSCAAHTNGEQMALEGASNMLNPPFPPPKLKINDSDNTTHNAAVLFPISSIQGRPILPATADTTQGSTIHSEDAGMKGISASTTTVTHLQDGPTRSESNNDQAESRIASNNETAASSEVLLRTDSHQDSMEIDGTVVEHDAMDIEEAKPTELSTSSGKITQDDSAESKSEPQAMELVVSTDVTSESQEDDNMVDMAEISTAHDTDAMQMDTTPSPSTTISTSLGVPTKDPQPSKFGRVASTSNNIPSISPPGNGTGVAFFSQPPTTDPMVRTPFSGVAAALIHESPNLHMYLQDALPEIVKERDSLGAQGICDEVCEAIRNAKSAEGLALDIQCEMQKEAGVRLLTETQLLRLKIFAFKARYGKLPHQQQDSSMADAAPEPKAELSSPSGARLHPHQPSRSTTAEPPVSVVSVNVEMADVADDIESSKPSADSQKTSAPDEGSPETQAAAAETGTDLAGQAADQPMQDETPEDKLLALVTMGMKRLQTHMFPALFQIDLFDTANREGIEAFLIKRRWKGERQSPDAPVVIATRNVRAAVENPAPFQLEMLLFDCQKQLARQKIECKNPRCTNRNVGERKKITGDLINEMAQQNYNLMKTMKVPRPMAWDDIVRSINAIDKASFAASIVGTTESMWKYKEHMKPFIQHWTKPTAVEDYLLDVEEALNPGSRPTPITPANRAPKHRISAEHDTLARDRTTKRSNRGEQ